MSSKITLPSFVTLLAMQSGLDRQLCEDFMRELLAILISSLGRGETVKVRGLGSFRLTAVQPRRSVDVSTGESIEIAAHYKVTFSPSRELAQAVNAPFEAFRTVEIPLSVNLDPDLDYSPVEEDEDISTTEETVSSEEIPAPEVSDDSEEFPAHEVTASPEKTNTPPEVTPYSDILIEEISSKEDIQTSDENIPKPVMDQHHSTHTHKKHHRSHTSRRQFNLGFLMGFISAVAVGALIWLFYTNPLESTREMENYQRTETTTDTITAKSDTVKKETSKPAVVQSKNTGTDEVSVPTKATGEVMRDTITKTRYLTTMAKEHYGNFNFWPYIYEENKSLLGHPDRIRPGTAVIVPPLSKYGVSPDNPADVAEAKRRGAAIYARFK